jgi:hypothetical protein
MSQRFHANEDPVSGRVKQRIYCARLLCALLLLFCISAKSNNYDTVKHSLRIATQQAFISTSRTQRDHPKATLLELFYLAAGSISLFLAAPITLRRTTALAQFRRGGFDPELYLRPPPYA